MKLLLYFLIYTLALIMFLSTADADCKKVDNTTATKQICNSIVVDDPMKFCCFITYKEKPTKNVRQKCKLLENTRFGINLYEETFDNVSGLKILCSAQTEILILTVLIIIEMFIF